MRTCLANGLHIDNFAFFVLGNIDLLSTPVLLELYADCQSDVPK